jgi:hypothetical protein
VASGEGIRKMAKQRGIGCGTIIGFILLLFSLASFAILGGSAYIAYDMATHPDEFFKKYASSVEFIGKRAVSVLNSNDPSEVPEGFFDADAYMSFIRKQGEIADKFQNIQDEYSFAMEITEAEVSSILKQDLARWEITRYALDFKEGLVRMQVSVPGHILTPLIPKQLPSAITNTLDSLKQINIDSSLEFEYDGGIKKLNVKTFSLGQISFSPWMLDLFNQRVKGEMPKLESWLKGKLASMEFSVEKLLFQPDTVIFSGSTTKSFR